MKFSRLLNPNKLSGKHAHNWQRISAYYLLIYIPFLAAATLFQPSHTSLQDLLDTLMQPFYLLPNLLALILMLIHSWVGLRDILLDYTPLTNTPLWLAALHWLLIFIIFDLVVLIVMVMTPFESF
ncbi:succinate dehydrogenase, hydrophobic membrane anchor protein [Thiomicrorhabdus chilensis]|uniref:succinate dehydrogenase, hydrophobic membrane anchor protein n=1 Tax=Thiomicrorhabdus chilensis TaxID=63656 RepID=UPI00048C42BD|nr:succinate dehydrogenase, hydrophobic membrane anchor protein [Thiomicrorhabdus chilensis]